MTPLVVADPERRLALVYAPAPTRPALEALWLIDERMGSIVAAAREPAIGAMRLIWWRDALAALDDRDAPAEPLLERAVATLLPAGVTGTELAAIEEGWAALLEDEVPDEAALILHSRARGGTLFTLAAKLLGASTNDVAIAGEGWALADLGHRTRDPATATQARALANDRLAALSSARWPRALRPIGLLTLLARRDANSQKRQQGSPARVLRAMLYGLTG